MHIACDVWSLAKHACCDWILRPGLRQKAFPDYQIAAALAVKVPQHDVQDS